MAGIPVKTTKPVTKPTTTKLTTSGMSVTGYTGMKTPTAKTATTPTTSTATTTPAFDQTAYLKGLQDNVNNLYDAQKTAQLAALKTQRDQTIGGINQQITDTSTDYQGKRNQADVVNAQNVQKLREMMAAQGLSSSGENVTANVAQNNARLNSLNNLNLQEQSTINDFKRRIADLSNGADEQNVTNELEAQRAQALLNAGYRADDTGYQRSRDAVGDQRYTDETTYNHGRDALGDQRYTDETTYNHGRDTLADTRYTDETKYNRGRDAIGDQRYTSETAYNHGQDTQQQKNWQATFNNSVTQQKNDEKWKQKTWNEMSPAEKQQMALQYTYSQKGKKSSGGGSGGSHRSSSKSSKNPSSVPKNVQDQYKTYQKWFVEPKKTSKKPSQNLTYSTNGVTRQAGY